MEDLAVFCLLPKNMLALPALLGYIVSVLNFSSELIDREQIGRFNCRFIFDDLVRSQLSF
jgi:hypothetical protein